MKEKNNDKNQLETRNDVVAAAPGNGNLRHHGETQCPDGCLDRNR